jgi:ssDNA-binding Zn-finger/Zn-ribbon topoisomerase 1
MSSGGNEDPHSDYYYYIVEDEEGGGEVTTSSGQRQLIFHIVMWLSALVAVILIFVMLHYYHERESRRNTMDEDDKDDTQRARRERKKRRELFSTMQSRNMLKTVSFRISTNDEDETSTGNTIGKTGCCEKLEDGHDSDADETLTVYVENDLENGACGTEKTTENKDGRTQNVAHTDPSLSSTMILSSESMMMCAICLDDYQAGDVVVRSCHPECEHIFHRDCLLDTFVKKKIPKNTTSISQDDKTKYPCPCCRRPYFFLVAKENENNKEQQQQNDDGCFSSAAAARDEDWTVIESGFKYDHRNRGDTATTEDTMTENSIVDNIDCNDPVTIDNGHLVVTDGDEEDNQLDISDIEEGSLSEQ